MPACNILDIAQVLADYYKKELDYEVI